MHEDSLDQMKEQIIQEEVPKSNSEPGEADSTATGSEIKELLSRGGSAPLQVDLEDDSDEEVKEVAAQPKTAEELANLKIIFHRTPAGVGASADVRGKYKYEIVSLPKHMYPNQFRAAQRKKKLALRGGSSSASASSPTRPTPAVPPKALAPVRSSTGARPKELSFRIPKTKARAPTMVPPVKVLTSTTPVVPQPMAPVAAMTPVIVQPIHPENSNVVISNVALRRILLPPPTETELASSNGVREGFAHWRPREANAEANPVSRIQLIPK
jgi:hypothetical protein